MDTNERECVVVKADPLENLRRCFPLTPALSQRERIPRKKASRMEPLNLWMKASRQGGARLRRAVFVFQGRNGSPEFAHLGGLGSTESRPTSLRFMGRAGVRGKRSF